MPAAATPPDDRAILAALVSPLPATGRREVAVNPDQGARVGTATERAAAADRLPSAAAIPPAETMAHPLSPRLGQTFSIFQPTVAETSQAIAAAWDRRLPDDPSDRQRALALWRFLPDTLRPPVAPAAPPADPRSGAADWWPGYPLADPAYPDSAHQAAAMRAACLAAGPEPALLLVSLASVQEYISDARRTQDLWMGSYLYAYFVWRAMRPIVAALGPWAILTPDVRGLPFLDLWLGAETGGGLRLTADRAAIEALLPVASLPNIFTALVPKVDAEYWGNAAVAGALEARDAVADAVKAYVSPAVSGTAWEPVWNEQIADFLAADFFWAAAPWTTMDEDEQRLSAVGGAGSVPDDWKKWRREVTGGHQGGGFPLVGVAASRLFTARKALRNFGSGPVTPAGRVCTLCGARAALPWRWDELRRYNKQDGGSRLKLQGRLRRGEQLCAVCVVKRLALDAFFDKDKRHGAPARRAAADPAEAGLGVDRHLFSSTATIATLPFRKQLVEALTADDPATTAAVDAWLARLGDAVKPDKRPTATLPGDTWLTGNPALDRLDGSWFYSASYEPDVVQREFSLSNGELETARTVLPIAAAKLREVNVALKRWLRAERKTYFPPARYYAVVAMDGDHIGDWLTGKKNPFFKDLLGAGQLANVSTRELDLRRPAGPMSHGALAAVGRAFAFGVAPAGVAKNGGALIYAGGDDTLALSPRVSALRLAADLARQFTMPGTAGGELLLGPAGSISAAVVIAHHSAPLADVMREAQATLKQVAKTRYGRNAFAIRLLKRSGPAVVAGLPWMAGGIDVAARFDVLLDGFRGKLSRGVIADFRRAGEALGGEQTRSIAPEEHRAIRAEMVRLALRHAEGMGPKRKHEVGAAVGDLYDAAQAALNTSVEKKEPREFVYCPPPAGKQPPPRVTAFEVVAQLARAAEFMAREDEG